jgi:hypothetical protein
LANESAEMIPALVVAAKSLKTAACAPMRFSNASRIKGI